MRENTHNKRKEMEMNLQEIKNLTALGDTGNVIASMLTENTGIALCDSGGSPQYDDDGKYIGSQHGYGRNWERNQGRNF